MQLPVLLLQVPVDRFSCRALIQRHPSLKAVEHFFCFLWKMWWDGLFCMFWFNKKLKLWVISELTVTSWFSAKLPHFSALYITIPRLSYVLIYLSVMWSTFFFFFFFTSLGNYWTTRLELLTLSTVWQKEWISIGKLDVTLWNVLAGQWQPYTVGPMCTKILCFTAPCWLLRSFDWTNGCYS